MKSVYFVFEEELDDKILTEDMVCGFGGVRLDKGHA